MTLLDWGLIILVGGFLVRGLFRGFFVELFSLLAIVAGYFAARLAGPPLALQIAQSTPISRWVAGILAAVTLFIVANLLFQLLGRLLRRVMKSLALAGFDRLLGALFGAGKSVFLILIVLFLLSLTPWSRAIGEYTEQGRISSWFWLGGMMVREAAGVEPIAPTMAMARWLRAAGLSDEAVHLITDRPDLMLSLLDYARRNQLKIPVDQILAGEPAIPLPSAIEIGPAQQQRLVKLLEDTTLEAGEQAKKFWDLFLSSGSM